MRMYDLKEEARRAYRAWPVFLMRRLRQLEQHLDEAIADLPAPRPDTLLHAYDLPLPDPVPDIPDVPAPDVPDGDAFFRTGPTIGGDGSQMSLDFVVRAADETRRRELVRMRAQHAAYLERACATFDAMLDDHDPGTALTQALIWSRWHNSIPQPWQTVPPRILHAYLPVAHGGTALTIALRQVSAS